MSNDAFLLWPNPHRLMVKRPVGSGESVRIQFLPTRGPTSTIRRVDRRKTSICSGRILDRRQLTYVRKNEQQYPTFHRDLLSLTPLARPSRAVDAFQF